MKRIVFKLELLQKGRTPRGVRGLKLARRGCVRTRQKPHPARGAWIETMRCVLRTT